MKIQIKNNLNFYLELFEKQGERFLRRSSKIIKTHKEEILKYSLEIIKIFILILK
ncbi:MAG: hypothetical protein IJP12_00480 [Methanobrevibacter sp.]|nr:hypothetical protein [Methanobrevibacter sp.]